MSGFDDDTWEIVIGLEVHAELLTRTKLFSSAVNRFGGEPNTNIDPLTIGLPGSLPVLNEHAVELAIRVGLALNCTVQRSVFARKNYFYPDQPKNYQISQYELPINIDGWLELPSGEQVGIERAHLEEDTGKSTHVGGGGRIHDAQHSLVDLNRAGVPLLEIVGRPDLRSVEDAKAYVAELRAILVAVGASDGKMEEGSLRVDCNVSVRRRGDDELGTRCEIKNVNSLRAMGRAIDYEAARQVDLLTSGEEVVQQTRHWNDAEGRTTLLRSKEDADDYRYFPDPDLVPLVVEPAWVEEIRRRLPELPEAKRRRFVREYGIPEYDAGVLTASKELAEYYEACVRAQNDPKVASNWVMVELLGRLNKDGKDIVQSPIPAERLAALLGLLAKGAISGKMAKEFFDEMYASGADPEEILRAKGGQITDAGELEAIVRTVIEKHAGPVAEYRRGKETALNFLVGQVMRATSGKANPKLVNELLARALAP